MIGVSINEAARQIGVTGPALLKAQKKGRIEFEADGSVIVEKVRLQLAKNRQRAPTNTSYNPALDIAPVRTGGYFAEKRSEPLYMAKAAIEARRAELLEIELAEKRGKLLHQDHIEQAYAAKLVAGRDAALSAAARLAPIVAAESDQNTCYRLIWDEMVAMLRLLSQEAPRPAS